MVQGMSEEEVKKKLYGEFVEVAKGVDESKPKTRIREESISIKPPKKFFSIKSISIVGAAFLVLLSIIIISVTRPKAKIESPVITETGEIKGYLTQGKKYYKDGLFDEAILTWKSIIAIDPNHRTALRYIRRAELKKRELKIREEETSQKLKDMLAKREIQHLLKEGDTHFRKGDFSRAIAIYEKVLSLSPGNYHAVKNMTRAEKKVEGEKTKTEVAEKVEKPTKEVVPPVIEEGPLYTIQIATYLDRGRAEELVKKLTDKGYDKLSIKKVSAKSGKILYEVYLGTFHNKKDAARETERIKKEGFKDSFIKIK